MQGHTMDVMLNLLTLGGLSILCLLSLYSECLPQAYTISSDANCILDIHHNAALLNYCVVTILP